MIIHKLCGCLNGIHELYMYVVEMRLNISACMRLNIGLNDYGMRLFATWYLFNIFMFHCKMND